MKTNSEPAFDRIAKLLRERNCRIRIEGHTDNVPIHNLQFSSNWELSTSRATEIVRVLIVRNGYSPNRLSAAGYAEFHPVASNTTAEGRGVNRRVDVVVLAQDFPTAAPLAPEPGSSEAAVRRGQRAEPVPRTSAVTKMLKPSPAIPQRPVQ